MAQRAQDPVPELLRDSPAPAFTAAAVVIGLVAIDWSGYLRSGSNGRYAVLLVPLAAWALGSRASAGRSYPSTSSPALALLIAYGLIGSVIGRLYLGTTSPAYGMVLPLAAGAMLPLICMTERASRRSLEFVTSAALLYVTMHLLAVQGIASFLTTGEGGNYRHEKAFILALALAGCYALRWGKRLAYAVVATALIFAQYPAATYLVALVVLVATSLSLAQQQWMRVAGRSALVGLPMSVVVLLTRPDTVGSLTTQYFLAVGKTDNTGTRLFAWQLAWERVREHPWTGSAFTGNVSLGVPGHLLGQSLVQVEAHDDFLTVWMLGGALALGLLVWWIFSVNRLAGRARHELERSGRLEGARLTTALLITFNVFFAVALFNPVMLQVGSITAIAVIYAGIRTMSATARQSSVVSQDSRIHSVAHGYPQARTLTNAGLKSPA